jgi:hypothetical protein
MVWDTFSGPEMKFYTYKYDENVTVVRVKTQVKAQTLLVNKLVPYLSINIADDRRDMFQIFPAGLPDSVSYYGEWLIRILFPNNPEMSKAKCLWGRSPAKFFMENYHYSEMMYDVIFFNVICSERDDYYFKLKY